MLDETTYYFTAFAIDQNNDIIDSETSSITTDFGWHVTPNTLAWWTLDGTLNDASGNNRNATGSSNITYQTLSSGLKVAKLTSGNGGITVPGNIANLLNGDFTISMWTYTTGQGQSNTALMFGVWYDTDPFTGPNIWWGYNGNGKIVFRLRGGSGSNPKMMTSGTGTSTLQNKWIHICWTRINGENIGYIDAVQECTMSSTISTNSGNNGFILSRYGSSQSLASGSMSSNVIIENRGWTASEVQSYVNKTKGKYGLL